jgi:hypothetical protein
MWQWPANKRGELDRMAFSLGCRYESTFSRDPANSPDLTMPRLYRIVMKKRV